MKKYELLIVLPGTLDDKEVEIRIQEITALSNSYVQEAQVNSLGKSRLAYPIKQIRYGYFFNIFFQAEPAKVQELHEKLRVQSDLLRVIITNYNPKAKKTGKITSSFPAEALTADELLHQEEKIVKKEPQQLAETKTTPLDLKDIDKRLDEILDNEVISGV